MTAARAAWSWAVMCAVVVSACGDGRPIDAGTDAAPTDTSLPALDAPAFDAPAMLDAPASDAGPVGFGRVAGPCGRLPAELGTPTPSYFDTRLDFAADAYDDPAERDQLTGGAREILVDGTSGGSSGVSEAFAFEVLSRCEGATLIATETEIVYVPATSKKTDMLVEIDGVRIGVSVTRAVGFPPDAPYTTAEAAFIEDKLDDILESTMNVRSDFMWTKQILLIMAYGDMHATSIRAVWDSIDAASRADTIVYVVVTDGADDPIYF